jgi:[histone H3]-lysine4 N-trimethyltransferase ATXR3
MLWHAPSFTVCLVCPSGRAAICLCGTKLCRGSFLYFSGSRAFMQIMNAKHTGLHRQAILLRASSERLTQGDRDRLKVVPLFPFTV